MTLDQLKSFCAIVERGSFRAAALETHRSQPAVSQQLKSLERELGKRSLIDRKSGRPTALGRVVYERARKLLLDADTLQDMRRWSGASSTTMMSGAIAASPG